MSPARNTRSLGATEAILGSVLAAVLCLGTACGGAPAPAPAPASAVPPQDPTPAPAPTPTQTDTDALAGEQVPDAGGADFAANVQPAFAAKAVAVLATLPIKGRAPKTGYSREEFGQAWADVDRNGCDTRNDILNRDLTAKTFKPGTSECVVLTGILADPYTAATIDFVRGTATSSAVQIDHVVALNDAWQKGAQQLTANQRTAFANDPLNLVAADGPANQQKGAGDAATWLPANKSYRCDYVARQISVKATYSLWVTQAEHDAMAKVLGNCVGIEVPTNQTAPPAVQQPQPVIVPPAAPLVQVPDVFYKNCSAVRAAGAAPLSAGQPGYNSTMDRDGDGVACE
ncbi:GmrSD restriction endonuclease domain-containing protein [Arthrobacter sp. TMN-49]